MNDVYVRSYERGRRKPSRETQIFLLILLLLGGVGGWWIIDRQKDEGVEKIGLPVEKKPESLSTLMASAPQPSSDAKKLFTHAQGLVSSGKQLKASQLLDDVISLATDKGLKNDAIQMQGRIHVELFFSEVPTPWKKNYVIQPGDSLDKIARKHKTTVDLIQRMNRIDGTLIFPGASLLLPAAPFVIEVDKSNRTLDLKIQGKRFKRYTVGVGRYGKTPTGTFTTVVHQSNPDWSPPSGGTIPFGDPGNVLGTRWISIMDATRPDIKGFGIHGTTNRQSIGSETSNGCIRMLNEEVEELFLLIPRGTQVLIAE